ncbi:glycosyltransferase family 71 protein [Mollisia scopiformis]|uniref:Glycosyltransferase family 71 protein n=1 Tax=Mollisia scopiformis TaxID=149040 RepID=A0A194XD51_MOLSC|nr:glycosyltransferase family 71 protein [Mollisia scopiformis]KUJ17682.1 glycosyltransferase family 71 protein [Mollisia scopiformis]
MTLAAGPRFSRQATNAYASRPIDVTDFSWFTPKSPFWHAFAPKLHAAKPKCAPPKLSHKAVTGLAVAGSVYHPTNLLEMSDEDVLSMKRSHALFLDMLDYDTSHLSFTPGTQGIVTTAGGAYFPVLLTSLLLLRQTGSALPVEIFILDDSEYESLVCESVFPQLGATCILLSPFLASSNYKFVVEGYQIKILSILFSSFEHVLFLDADNFPVSDPEPLFSSSAYTSAGLVLWKDFWKPTFSPHFVNITSTEPSLENTIEAGQILVSRRERARTLMLAAYYNIWGEWYFDLITQGGPGEGDKDTFLPAARAVGEEVYVVGRGPEYLGARGNGAAVLQFDAVGDWACAKERVAPLFIHASWPPKLNALHNVRSERQWGSEEHALSLFGADMEKVAWGFMIEMACEGEFWDWGEGNKTSTGVCEQTRGCFRNMFGQEYIFKAGVRNESFES